MDTTNFAPKTILVVLAHGKKLNSEEQVAIISGYDASLGREMIRLYLEAEFAKMGAELTAVGFSDPMDYDYLLMMAEEKARAAEKCLSA